MTWTPPGPAWLFCPADRPERFGKAAATADVVILDLEDGVALDNKDAARRAIVDTPLDPDSTVVRINPIGTADHARDLAALRDTAYWRIMLPKAESDDLPDRVADYSIIALIETPMGAMNVWPILGHPAVVGAMWGAEDLIAGLGGSKSRTSTNIYRDVARHVRSSVLLAAKASAKLAIDSVYLDIADTAGLAAECDDAVAAGFDVKVAIHPSQVAVIAAAYVPADTDVDWARQVLAAADGERGVFAFDGRMVDAPVLRHAEQILARATATASADQ